MAKYIYGPVYSWRLGRSLGIDLLSQDDKICTFDCVYCQVGNARAYAARRKIFVKTSDILREIKALPKSVRIDYVTFSGKGEPTLAKNLGQTIKAIKAVRKEPVAVLTNSTLLGRKDVRAELAPADRVSCKIDACDEGLFRSINRPDSGIRLAKVIRDIRRFRENYKGILSVQVMFMKNNVAKAKEIAAIAKSVGASAIEINTPLREPSEGALSRKSIDRIKKYFKGFNVVCVYDKEKKKIKPIDRNATGKRRGVKNV